MPNWTLQDLSKKMKNLDICILSSQTSDGDLNARPMSNNGDVEYDGDSFFFSTEDSNVVQEIEENSNVSLSFNGKSGLYIAVIGDAELITDRHEMEPHWKEDLEKWFKEGLSTPGVVMIQVRASRIRYWEGEEQGEITV